MDEQAYQTAMAEQQLVASVGYEVQMLVAQNWNRPPSARRGMEVQLRVTLVPTGGLTAVEIIESSGDTAFDNSALQAVQKAAPFDVMKELVPVVFEQNFRNFSFIFNPLDLRQ